MVKLSRNELQAESATKNRHREAKIGVIGLGYVGLPLAVEFAQAGFNVLGVDVETEKVQEINAGRSYIGDVPDECVRELVDAGKLSATTCYDHLREIDAISIACRLRCARLATRTCRTLFKRRGRLRKSVVRAC